ncbi:hypothetical protein CDAR_215451 [Caerostris darwini]|uniref:Uncharacterized protein n=1 Tax=Caerostris darwini TaxID=1538125 RepID=A0AAV4VU45_9ARAC|nr:hypothetical protein CDAR_215451 [Caerostris darwini]
MQLCGVLNAYIFLHSFLRGNSSYIDYGGSESSENSNYHLDFQNLKKVTIFPRGNGSRSDRGGSESSESSSVLSGLQDMENAVKYGSGIERLQMGAFLPLDIRKSEEPHLSTVSEVSEESSKNGMIRVRKLVLRFSFHSLSSKIYVHLRQGYSI